MRLNCLGTAGYHPNATRHTSGYFLPESGILLDAGSGTFRLASLIQTKSLDILLSHSHLDHTFGLTFLLGILFQRPDLELRIWGEQDKLDAIRQYLFSELLFPIALPAEWCAIDGLKSLALGDAEVTWQHQHHPGGSVAYRIDWKEQQKSLVYATDTVGDVDPRSSHWKSGADILLHECYFRDNNQEWALKTGHCWTSRLIEVAQQCKPRRLLVTHVDPLDTSADPVDLARMRSELDCEVILAEDCLTLDF